MNFNTHRLSLENIEKAAGFIDPVFLNSPQFISGSISGLLGIQLIIKLETLNPIRCFKGRGADWLVSNAGTGTEFVCASAGNFGQAMAYACRKSGNRLTVYASENANLFKINRMRSLGAEVILFGSDFDAAKSEAKSRVYRNARFVEDGLDIETLEGSGTIALELLKFPQSIDIMLIPLGNGALFTGMARVQKQFSPQTRLIAVQASGASAMVESIRTGKFVVHDHIQTIADGIAVRNPIPQALNDLEGLVDDTLLVEEADIIHAMKIIHEHLGIVS